MLGIVPCIFSTTERLAGMFMQHFFWSPHPCRLCHTFLCCLLFCFASYKSGIIAGVMYDRCVSHGMPLDYKCLFISSIMLLSPVINIRCFRQGSVKLLHL
uniref:Uncharacterized protein n=1 Tax=Arundo donax TaxID=35708 RepID=A0A0A9APZ3_ARUDO